MSFFLFFSFIFLTLLLNLPCYHDPSSKGKARVVQPFNSIQFNSIQFHLGSRNARTLHRCCTYYLHLFDFIFFSFDFTSSEIVCHHTVSYRIIPCHIISYSVQSHHICSHVISHRLISSHLISSHPITGVCSITSLFFSSFISDILRPSLWFILRFIHHKCMLYCTTSWPG